MYLRALIEPVAKEQSGFITSGDLTALGVSRDRRRRAVRRGELVHRGRGVYSLPEVPLDPDVESRAIELDAVLSHETAAAWWGMETAHMPDVQHMTVPRQRHRGRDCLSGWRVHRADLAMHEIVRQRRVRITTPLRTVVDCARTLPLAAAVALADSAIRKKLIRLTDLEQAVAALPKGPGRRHVQQVVGLIDPKSGSILESLLRILLWEHGLLPHESQFAIYDRRRLVGYFDFAWPALRLILEADGFEFHSQREHLRRDCRRHTTLTRLGWWLLRFTWEDVVLFPYDVVAVVRDTLLRLSLDAA